MRALGISSCPFCGGRITVRWREVSVWHCHSCGLLLRNPVPRAEELEALYTASWSAPAQARAQTGGTDLRLARIYATRLLRSLGILDFGGRRILELGAGRGEMLTALGERGAIAWGVEPFGYDFLRQRGFTAFRRLRDLPPGLIFDGAVTVDVVEHLQRPWQDLAALGQRLRPGGFLYLSTLNTRGLNALLSGPRWREFRKDGHLLFFNAPIMRRVLATGGFKRLRRLRWQVVYHRNPVRRAMDSVLQAVGLDGGLRFLGCTPEIAAFSGGAAVRRKPGPAGTSAAGARSDWP
jgi:SAM-dependent methyltransferase